MGFHIRNIFKSGETLWGFVEGNGETPNNKKICIKEVNIGYHNFPIIDP